MENGGWRNVEKLIVEARRTVTVGHEIERLNVECWMLDSGVCEDYSELQLALELELW